MGHISLGSRQGVDPRESAPQTPGPYQPAIQTRKVAVDKIGAEQLKKIVERSVFHRKRAVHVGLAQVEPGIEEQFAM